MTENAFLQNLNLAPPPWHNKVTGAGTHATHTVHDLTGRTLANIAPQGGTVKGTTYRNTLAAITHAPQLLAALLEAQYLLDSLGYPPTQSLRDLVLNSGGPDLQSQVSSNSVWQTTEDNAHLPPENS